MSIVGEIATLVLPHLGAVARLAAAALKKGGYTRDEARDELLSYLAEVLSTDEALERIQERRQRRLDARIPPDSSER